MFISSSRALVSLKQHLSPKISDLLWLVFHGGAGRSSILYYTSITWNTHLSVRDPISRLSPHGGSVDTAFLAELQAGLENRIWDSFTSYTTALPERSCEFHSAGRKEREDSTAQWLGNFERWGRATGFTQATRSPVSVGQLWQPRILMSPFKKSCYGDLPLETGLDSTACRHWTLVSLCYGLFQGCFCCVCRFPPNSGMHYRGRLCVLAPCLYPAFLGLATEDTCFSPKYDSREAQRLHPALCSYNRSIAGPTM